MAYGDINKMIADVNTALEEINNGNYDESMEICYRVLHSVPVHFLSCISDAFHMIGTISAKRGFRKKALVALEKAHVFYPKNPQIISRLGHFHLENDDVEKAKEYYDQACSLNIEDPLLDSLRQSLQVREDKLIPGILLNTIPKSGSISIWSGLYSGLKVPRLRVGCGIGSLRHQNSDPEKVNRLVQGSCVAQEHLPAIFSNLSVFQESGLEKMLLHVRDPRQALLSWVHHMDRMNEKEGIEPMEYPLCDNYFNLNHSEQIKCEAYFSKTLEEKIGIHIDHYLPILVNWLTGWLDVLENDSSCLEIKITYFEDLKNNPVKFYEDILGFYDIDPDKFEMPATPEKGINHFRKGEVDEFRTVFNEQQLEKSVELMPERLFSTFGWEK